MDTTVINNTTNKTIDANATQNSGNNKKGNLINNFNSINENSIEQYYKQEQRQLNTLLMKLANTKSIITDYTMLSTDLSENLVNNFNEYIRFLTIMENALSEMKKIDISTFVKNIVNAETTYNQKLLQALSAFMSTENIKKEISDIISKINDNNVKNNLLTIVDKIGQSSLNEQSILNLQTVVSDMNKTLTNSKRNINTWLLLSVGTRVGFDNIDDDLKRMNVGDYSDNYKNAMSKYNLLGTNLQENVQESDSLLKKETSSIEKISLLNQMAISKIREYEEYSDSTNDLVKKVRKDLDNIDVSNSKELIDGVDVVNLRILGYIEQLKNLVDLSNNEYDKTELYAKIDEFNYIVAKNNQLIEASLGTNTQGIKTDVLNQIKDELCDFTNKIPELPEKFIRMESSLMQYTYIKRRIALRDEILSLNKQTNGVFNNQNVTNNVVIHGLQNVGSSIDVDATNNSLLNLSVRTSDYNALSNGEFTNKEMADKNLDLLEMMKYGDTVLTDVNKQVSDSTSNKYSLIDKSVIGNGLDRVGNVGTNIGGLQLQLLNNIKINKMQYFVLSKQDKEDLEYVKQSANKSLEFINKILIAFETLGKKDAVYDNLNDIKSQLEKEIDRVDDLTGAYKELGGIISTIKKSKNFVASGLIGMLSAMGIASIVKPTQLLMMALNRYKQMGINKANLSLADMSMGLDINPSLNRDLNYTTSQYYYELTNGMADFNLPVKLYTGMVKNVGAQYGKSAGQGRNDLHNMAKQLSADKLLYDLPNSDIYAFIKNYYKDLGASARETVDEFRKMEVAAMSSNVPIETLLHLTNSLSSSFRNMGVDIRRTESIVMGTLGYNKLRVEDTTQIAQSTVNAATKMGNDWGRNLFWSMFNGTSKGTPFGTINRGLLSHDRYGKPIDEYYTAMFDNLSSESEYFGNRWGINSDIGQADMIDRLMRQGYTQQQASILVSLKKEGKLEEFKKKLKGFDDINSPMGPANGMKDLSAQLKISADQLAGTQKIKTNLIAHLNKIADIIDVDMGMTLNVGAKWIGDKVKAFGKAVSAMIGVIGGVLSSPTGMSILNTMAENPIKSFFAATAIAKFFSYGMKNLGRFGLRGAEKIFSHARGGSSSSLKGGGATKLALVALGATLLETSNVYASDGQNSTDAEGSSWGSVANLFETGKAKMTIVNGGNGDGGSSVMDRLKYFVGGVGAPIMAYMMYKYFKINSNVMKHHLPHVRMEVERLKKVYTFKNKRAERHYVKMYRKELALRNQYSNYLNQYKTLKMNQSKLFGKNFLLNMLFATGTDLLGGNSDGQLGTNLAIDVGGASAGMATEMALNRLVDIIPNRKLQNAARFLLPTIGGMVANYGADSLLSGILLGHNDTDKTTETFADNMNKIANALGISNVMLVSNMKQNLNSHGISYDKITENEKKLWGDKFAEFCVIFGDYNTALDLATQSLKNFRLAAKNLKTFNQIQLNAPELVKDENGKYTLDKSNTYRIYGEVEKQWKKDDNAKAKWYERKAQGADNTKDERMFDDLANYYYHALDDNNDSGYWFDRANQIHEMQGQGDEYYNWLDEQYGMWRNGFTNDSGNRFDSESIFTAKAYEVKQFFKWMAENREPFEAKEYRDTIGAEQVDDVVQQLVSGMTNGASNGSGSVGDGSALNRDLIDVNHGWGDDYYTHWSGLKSGAVSGMNALAQAYNAKFGGKLMMTGAAETWIHQAGEFGHHGGWKTDVVGNNIDEEKWIAEWAAEHGYAAMIEDAGGDNEHVDINWHGGSSDGTGNYSSQLSSDTLKNIAPIKNKTLPEIAKEKKQDFEDTLKSIGINTNDAKSGNLVDGMYVVAGQKVKTVEDRIKELRSDSINHNAKMKDGTNYTDTATLNSNAIASRTAKEMEQHPETIVKKNWKIRDILAQVEDIVNDYMIHPLISCNVRYK